ncbi:MAG: GIY-YIG nuclease family protein [Lachnospiraceae bacterium]|jgi:putative endonuclease|nr:GIY-YIG nuclease family protein [Lachnospiraceae bacterium]
MNFVYILRLNDDSLYTGWTNNLEKRMETHKAGKGSKVVRAKLPFELVHVEKYNTKEEAMKREYEIKHKLSKKEKEELVKKGLDKTE